MKRVTDALCEKKKTTAKMHQIILIDSSCDKKVHYKFYLLHLSMTIFHFLEKARPSYFFAIFNFSNGINLRRIREQI